MQKKSIAILIYGAPGSDRNALTEEKYKDLAAAFIHNGIDVHSVIYNDEKAIALQEELLEFDAVLVWVNPIEQGNNRNKLDTLLREISDNGCFVSTHPDTILKMGTKDILFKTRDTDFGTEVRLYHDLDELKEKVLNESVTRILKQYRGNGGTGVFKIEKSGDSFVVTHAEKGSKARTLSREGFIDEFKNYFEEGGILIDQPWNENIINGMVRCYLSGKKVAGFGYQEVNALYPGKDPGKRFYFSEDCGLFRDLRKIMEEKWVTDIQRSAGVSNEMLPVIWDADFFINDVNTAQTNKKYKLCEINVSCVSPFPESAIPYIIEQVNNRTKN